MLLYVFFGVEMEIIIDRIQLHVLHTFDNEPIVGIDVVSILALLINVEPNPYMTLLPCISLDFLEAFSKNTPPFLTINHSKGPYPSVGAMGKQVLLNPESIVRHSYGLVFFSFSA